MWSYRLMDQGLTSRKMTCPSTKLKDKAEVAWKPRAAHFQVCILCLRQALAKDRALALGFLTFHLKAMSSC